MFPISPHQDPVLTKLVKYVADYLNTAWTDQCIVRHTEIYDAYGVPHDSYPLLKIYRRYARATISDDQRDTELTLSYSLLNVQVQKTPAIANWINVNIIHALQQYRFDFPNHFVIDDRITCRYRTVLQLGEIIYQVETDFSITKETAGSCDDTTAELCEC